MIKGCGIALVLLAVIIGVGAYFSMVTTGRVRYEPTAEDREKAAAADAAKRKASEEAAKNRQAEDARNQIRLVRENHRLDDGARALIFKALLKGSGARCDSVDQALMRSAGVWSVRCSPGYRYQITFDKNGEPTQLLAQ